MIRSTMKRILVGVLSAAMVLGSTLTVSASTITKSGSGESTGEAGVISHGALEVANVMLPTTTVGATTGNVYSASALNFAVDPGRLIPKVVTGNIITKSSLVGGVTEAGVYFLHPDQTYHPTSAALKVTNKSSFEINLSLNAVLTGGSFAIATSSSVKNTTSEALYMGFIVKTGTSLAGATGVVTDMALSGTAKTVNVKLGAVETNFKMKGNGNALDLQDSYNVEMIIDPNANTGAWINAFFNLEGACGQSDGATTNTPPDVDLTWSWTAADGNSATTLPADKFGWSSTGQYFYFGVPGVESIDLSKVSDFVASQGSTNNAVATANLSRSSSGGFFTVTWNQIKTNMTWPSNTNPTATIKFTFKYDGKSYTCTHKYTA